MAKRRRDAKPSAARTAPAEPSDNSDDASEGDAGDAADDDASSTDDAAVKQAATAPPPATATRALIRRHLVYGWWALAIFTALGLILEAAHGLKMGWYLNITNATRRLSFTLAHAHGTLLGLLNIAFAVSLREIALSPVTAARASFALRAVTVLLPLGFLLGGVAFYAGDPGYAIILVPPSGALLLIGLVMIARDIGRR